MDERVEMRVLVTGSRDWDKRYKVNAVLRDVFSLADTLGATLLLVHGDCPTGADAMAQEWADRHSVKTERHPADWKKLGKGAGPRRNEIMVDLGADLVLAFARGSSPGTAQTIALARNAGLSTFVINYDDDLGYDMIAGADIVPLKEVS